MTTLVYCQCLAQELSPWDVWRASTWEGVLIKLHIEERERERGFRLQRQGDQCFLSPQQVQVDQAPLQICFVTTVCTFERLHFSCKQKLCRPSQQCHLSRWRVYLKEGVKLVTRKMAEAPKELRQWSKAKSCIVTQSGMSRSKRATSLIPLQLQLLQSLLSQLPRFSTPFSVANIKVTKSRGQLSPLWGPISSCIEVRGCEMGLSAPW